MVGFPWFSSKPRLMARWSIDRTIENYGNFLGGYIRHNIYIHIYIYYIYMMYIYIYIVGVPWHLQPKGVHRGPSEPGAKSPKSPLSMSPTSPISPGRIPPQRVPYFGDPGGMEVIHGYTKLEAGAP